MMECCRDSFLNLFKLKILSDDFKFQDKAYVMITLVDGILEIQVHFLSFHL